tara:strand:- start:1484 stop:1735 length:252 start_codon:yes stop_codon:yes gene_type:complete
MSKKPINVEVRPKHNEHPERTIRRFIKKCKKERIVEEYRDRMYYTKKAEKRRKQKYLRKRKAQLAEQERQRAPKNTRTRTRRR